VQPTRPWPTLGERSINCIYVSPIWLFKHQWIVVRAIAALRRRGYQLNLVLVGGGTGKAKKLVEKEIKLSDPDNVFVTQLNFVAQERIPALLAEADLFVFASSCENMPVTLIEGMAAGLPIACSNRGPMPEVLQDGGVYFDPEDSESIADAIEKIIKDPILRDTITKRAKNISEQYSWSHCGDQTWEFISRTYHNTQSMRGLLN
jgi:glycosyltransferase involved in cell wall biosynthesis